MHDVDFTSKNKQILEGRLLIGTRERRCLIGKESSLSSIGEEMRWIETGDEVVAVGCKIFYRGRTDFTVKVIDC